MKEYVVRFVKFYHYDAFSKEPNKGNPAEVVLSGDKLTDTLMQETDIDDNLPVLYGVQGLGHY